MRARESQEKARAAGAARSSSRPPRCCASCPTRSACATAQLEHPGRRRSGRTTRASTPPRGCCWTSWWSKLDFLLSFYLRMRHSLVPLRPLLLHHRPRAHAGADGDAGARDREGLRARQGSEDAHQGACWRSGMERYDKALENKQLIDAQTETVQEVLQLLRDQSYSMRDPRIDHRAARRPGLLGRGDRARRASDMEDLLSLEKRSPAAGRPGRGHRGGAAVGPSGCPRLDARRAREGACPPAAWLSASASTQEGHPLKGDSRPGKSLYLVSVSIDAITR